MIAQQELQRLLKLPLAQRLEIAQQLIESAVVETRHETKAPLDSNEPSPSAKWLLSMAGMFSGGPGNTAENADEICQAEIQSRSGFTTKPPLED